MFPDDGAAEKSEDKGKSKKSKDETNSDVKVFIDWFSSWYQTTFGKVYLLAKGKEWALVKRLLARLTLDDLKAAAVNMAEDSWWRDKVSIGNLSSQINQFHKRIQMKGSDYDSKQSGGNRQFEAANQQAGKFDRKQKTVIHV